MLILSAETIEIIRKKHNAWQRYKESGYLDEDKLKIYHRLRNKVTKATRYYQKCKEKEAADRKFYQYINGRKKTTEG